MSDLVIKKIPKVKVLKEKIPKKSAKKITENPEKSSKNYLTNANLLEQFKLSKQQGRLTEEFGKMFVLLCDRIGNRPNFSGYTYLDEMKSAALVNLCRNWGSFDDTKSSNLFSYYSSFIFHVFIQIIKSEKRLTNIKNKMLIDSGLEASFSYVSENSNNDGSIDPRLLFDAKEIFVTPSDDDLETTIIKNDINYENNYNDNNSIHLSDNLYRLFEHGECKISYVNNGEIIKILAIKTPFKLRNKGYAKESIRIFLKICDDLKISTSLNGVPLDDKTDGDQLLSWFKSLGYKRKGSKDFLMIRTVG
jgi:hypothetical protein